ncbi:MAG: hypothetical protein IKZ98_15855 [Clostridia bacterium]|nr:hypothetical protein [Clostridia bacterium]
MKKRLALLLALYLALGSLSAAFAESASEPVQVDLDLSQMSGTIVYAQIYNIMYDPGPYLGKVIRVRGYYSFFREPSNGNVYYACVIPDATACCTQGMEFVPFTEPEDPDHFLSDNADITVTGRLETYVEDGSFYLHLVDADVQQNPEA